MGVMWIIELFPFVAVVLDSAGDVFSWVAYQVERRFGGGSGPDAD